MQIYVRDRPQQISYTFFNVGKNHFKRNSGQDCCLNQEIQLETLTFSRNSVFPDIVT